MQIKSLILCEAFSQYDIIIYKWFDRAYNVSKFSQYLVALLIY